MENKNLGVGLFGTCGNSVWRDAFMANYEVLGIPFFNPNKADWNQKMQ